MIKIAFYQYSGGKNLENTKGEMRSRK